MKIYVNDIGVVIEIDMGESLSTATNLKLEVRKPDNTEVEWTPTVYGTEFNFLRYTTVANDLDQAGVWKANPFLSLGGWTGLADTVTFEVYDKYN
jgi:hypothetical protein